MSFSEVLTAAQRSPEIPESADLYGGLIGSWDLDVLHYGVDVRGKGLTGEVHFSRVLKGRAVQDVRISDHMYGTTLRVWDGSIEAWRVTWVNPASGGRDELIGRLSGGEVVQVGTHTNGRPIRWRFTEITPDSFRWLGEVLEDDGRTWKLEGEFEGRRKR